MATERSAEKTALFRRFKILQLFYGKAQDKHLGQPKHHEVKTKGEMLFFISNACLEMVEQENFFSGHFH